LFSFRSIRDYHKELTNGSFTCVDAVRFYLTNIEGKKHLNAFVEVFEEEALQRAAELDKQSVKGKLHGVVVAIKDNICYKDHRVSAGSNILKDFTSLYSATAVERLLNEGAIIIGRVNCDEFAMGSTNENSAHGKVLNPIDESKVPGGSSGGSAVAVKAEMCMVSLGSDTGGSVRQPADFCSVVGFKPTYGSISRHGLIAYGSSFDVIGILSNKVDDAEIVFEVIKGGDEYDSTSHSNFNSKIKSDRPKLCYFKETIENPALDPEIRASFVAFTETLTNLGFSVEAVDFEWLDYIVPTYYILTTAEASSNLGRYDGIRYGLNISQESDELAEMYAANRTEGFGAEVKRRIMLGTFVLSAGYYDAYFTKAQQVRALINQQNDRLFSQFDFLLSPTSPTTAFEMGKSSKDPIEVYLADIYTVYANLTGIPAVSVPAFEHSNGMPFGLQVITSKGNDLPLLGFTKTITDRISGAE
jgi:aspartyl-tRNA(Asn)/glutamyl-tRNA(Gln) amidotransferase subunit A